MSPFAETLLSMNKITEESLRDNFPTSAPSLILGQRINRAVLMIFAPHTHNWNGLSKRDRNWYVTACTRAQESVMGMKTPQGVLEALGSYLDKLVENRRRAGCAE